LTGKAACVVLLILTFIVAGVYHSKIALAQPRTWTVDDDLPADFTRIQDALNASSTGDTIFVYNGTYNENVIISKSISLVGENKEAVIIDGQGVGTVVRVYALNVVIANFTVRNAGKTWGPPPVSWSPDSCILVDGVSNVQIKDAILTDAAVCTWIAFSSSVSVSGSSVFGGVYGGIICYASSQVLMSRNLIDDCGLMGIHLDAYSTDCTVEENTVMNNVEGLELEQGSAENRVEGNIFLDNNASIVLNKCGSSNVFRRNAMTNNVYNLVVVGYSLDNFLQDIDSSNIVNSKLVYYLANIRDSVINPLVYPNPGYLALVNCVGVKVENFDVFSNGDGILIAYSTRCSFMNVTVGGISGPLAWGGFTFYNSNNNTVVDSRVYANSYALTFYHSDGNLFHHNYFAENERQVVSDFLTPFSNMSSGYVSTNAWDDGVEGNFWSDYMGADMDKNGVGDTPYVIDSKNVDRYPLSSFPVVDMYPPNISIIAPTFGSEIRSSDVTIMWEGWDDYSGINHYEIRMDSGPWHIIGAHNATMYTFTNVSGGGHTVEIRAYDNAGNMREELINFSVNTGLLRVPSYVGTIFVAVIVIVAVGVALYVVRLKGLPRRRVVSRRLVR